MKQMGMDKMVNIVMPEKRLMWLVFPALKAYAEMAMPDETADMNDKDVKVAATEVGKETIDGHPCMKNKVIITDKKGKKQEAFTWNASDLKHFPVKMEFIDANSTVTMNFKNIKLAAPDAKQFDAPAGFARHTDIQQLMMAAMQKFQTGN